MESVDQVDFIMKNFSYNKDTGDISVKVRYRSGENNRLTRRSVGDIVGHMSGNGYLHFYVLNRKVRCHRAAWIISYGAIPEGYVVDHINGIRDDNRLENLRLLTQKDNTMYIHKPYSSSGYRGVYQCNSKKNPWCAQVNKIHLGVYKTPEEANTAVVNYLRSIGYEY